MQTKTKNKILAFIFVIIAQLSVPGITPNISSSEDEVIAVVNSEQIYYSQIVPFFAEYKKHTKKDQVTKEDKIQLLKNLIKRNLILQQDFTDNIRKSKEITKRVKDYEDKLVLEEYIRQNILNFLTVGEEEARQYYSNNLHKFVSKPKVNASHILLRTEEDAKQVMKKLKSGDTFTELARQYSIDLPMAFEGGAMGTITKGQTMPQLDEALFVLKEGETSSIVKTQYGWHILRVDKIITEQHVPYEEVKEQIIMILKREKEARSYDAMTQKLEKGADITIFKDRL